MKSSSYIFRGSKTSFNLHTVNVREVRVWFRFAYIIGTVLQWQLTIFVFTTMDVLHLAYNRDVEIPSYLRIKKLYPIHTNDKC